MPYEEQDHISDQKQLRAMYASAKDTRYIVRRTLELIEQSRIMLASLTSARPTTDEPRKHEGSSSFPMQVGLVHIAGAADHGSKHST